MTKILKAFGILLYKIFGYCIIAPISFFTSKQDNLILFVGKGEGEFSGNIKYMYAFLNEGGHKNGVEYYFLTSNQKLYETLKEEHLPAILYPGIKAFKILWKANVAFVDTNRWQHEFKYFFLIRSHVVQLWHGPPIKEIGSRAYSADKFLRWQKIPILIYSFLRNRIESRYTYSMVCCPSNFYIQKVFKNIFKADHFLNAGQPRNDRFQSKVLSINADHKTIGRIKDRKQGGYHIIYYLPTFREGESVPLKDIDFDRLAAFAKESKCIWLLKLHPNVNIGNNPELSGLLDSGDNGILLYDQNADIHCCLDLADILVTDYSSVYMDFLFFDKPILFFNYDYEQYTQNTRNLAFDYKQWAPGPKCENQDRLENTLKDILAENKDLFSEKRREIFQIVFDHDDGNASQRIWSEVRKYSLQKVN